MAIRPTRRGLLAGLAGGLFAWLAPKAAKAEAPATPPPASAAGGPEAFVRKAPEKGKLVFSTYLGGAPAPPA